MAGRVSFVQGCQSLLQYVTLRREDGPKINRVLHARDSVRELIFACAGEGNYIISGCVYPICPGVQLGENMSRSKAFASFYTDSLKRKEPPGQYRERHLEWMRGQRGSRPVNGNFSNGLLSCVGKKRCAKQESVRK